MSVPCSYDPFQPMLSYKTSNRWDTIFLHLIIHVNNPLIVHFNKSLLNRVVNTRVYFRPYSFYGEVLKKSRLSEITLLFCKKPGEGPSFPKKTIFSPKLARTGWLQLQWKWHDFSGLFMIFIKLYCLYLVLLCYWKLKKDFETKIIRKNNYYVLINNMFPIKKKTE